MGQYYKPFLIDKNGKMSAYNTYLDGQYIMAKLYEQSWWLNPFVNTICHKIFRKPMKVAWVGDYSNYGEKYDDGKGFPYYEKVYGDRNKNGRGSIAKSNLTESQVTLDGKYLVNYDKKEYLDCDEYYENSVNENDRCMHPLPLLTCVGNGRGGGDFHCKDKKIMKLVGSWCLDTISIEPAYEAPHRFNKRPMEGFKKISPVFQCEDED